MILLTSFVCGAGLLCALIIAPVDETTVAAIFPPWWSPAQIFGAAGSSGQIAGSGLWHSILVVHSDEPMLASRLRAHGALMTLPSFRYAACQNSEQKL